MELIFRGKNVTLGEDFREYAARKLDRLSRYLPLAEHAIDTIASGTWSPGRVTSERPSSRVSPAAAPGAPPPRGSTTATTSPATASGTSIEVPACIRRSRAARPLCPVAGFRTRSPFWSRPW